MGLPAGFRCFRVKVDTVFARFLRWLKAGNDAALLQGAEGFEFAELGDFLCTEEGGVSLFRPAGCLFRVVCPFGFEVFGDEVVAGVGVFDFQGAKVAGFRTAESGESVQRFREVLDVFPDLGFREFDEAAGVEGKGEAW